MFVLNSPAESLLRFGLNLSDNKFMRSHTNTSAKTRAQAVYFGAASEMLAMIFIVASKWAFNCTVVIDSCVTRTCTWLVFAGLPPYPNCNRNALRDNYCAPSCLHVIKLVLVVFDVSYYLKYPHTHTHNAWPICEALKLLISWAVPAREETVYQQL